MTNTLIGDRNLAPAGFWLRFFAYVLDFYIYSSIIAAIVWGIVVSFGAAFYSYMEKHNFDKAALSSLGSQLSPYSSIFTNSNVIVLIILSPLFLYILYYTVFEASFLRATPGKLALGLVVTDPEDNKARFGSILMRNVYKFLPNSLPILAIIIILFSAKVFPIALLFAPIIMIGSLIGSLVLFVVMYGSAGWSDEKQGLHDKWTYCYVQKKLTTSPVQRQGFALLSIALVLFSMFRGYVASDMKYTNGFKREGKSFKVVSPSMPNSTSNSITLHSGELKVEQKAHKPQPVVSPVVAEKKAGDTLSPSEPIPDFPSDSQERSLQILKRGKEVDMGGLKNAITNSKELPPVEREYVNGMLRVGKTKVILTHSRAALKQSGRIVEVLLYGKLASGKSLPEPIMKLYFSYKSGAGNCVDKHLQKYLVKIRASYFGVKHVKKDEYITYQRRGGDINLNEKISVSCQRHTGGGWVRLQGGSREAVLLYGVRYPVVWDLILEDTL